ncbi:putative orphan protein [Pseudoalteromonas luteoviolacea B = ATCC 29581]|nr:putative orphan protein [Pseudoalteromonas luteoviolacea B = ATCC 29581]
MLQFEYGSAQREQLNQVLSTSEHNLAYVEGYLFGDICSPNASEPEQWLMAIGIKTASLTEEDVFAFMALHHHVSEAVFSQQGYLLLDDESFDWSQARSWSLGFLASATTYLETLCNASGQSDQMIEALQFSVEQLGFFALEKQHIMQFCEANQLNLEVFLNEQYALMKEFSMQFARLIETAAQVLFK